MNSLPCPPFIQFCHDKESPDHLLNCLAWNRLTKLSRAELDDWLNRRKAKDHTEGLDMQKRLTRCMAWRWVIKFSAAQINERLAYLEPHQSEEMRKFITDHQDQAKQHDYEAPYAKHD